MAAGLAWDLVLELFLALYLKYKIAVFRRFGVLSRHKQKAQSLILQGFALMKNNNGADSRIRTGDPILTMDVLYLLS